MDNCYLLCDRIHGGGFGRVRLYEMAVMVAFRTLWDWILDGKHNRLVSKFQVGLSIMINWFVSLVPESIFDIQQIKFDSGVRFDDLSGDESLVHTSDEPIYVGEPSPEIDQAWETLVDGRYFSISEDEAKRLWGKDYEIYRDLHKGGFTGGYWFIWCTVNNVANMISRFDMFHGLHCLVGVTWMGFDRDYTNQIRIIFEWPFVETTTQRSVYMELYIIVSKPFLDERSTGCQPII
jgi:hypothetical protein